MDKDNYNANSGAVDNDQSFSTNKVLIHNDGNFGIGEVVLEKWTTTRKGRMRYGNFPHPGIYSTVGFNVDRSWFAFAMLIEAATIFISIVVTGFNPVVVGIAVIVVIVDIALAIFLHKPQQDINKFECELAKTEYENQHNLFDSSGGNANDHVTRIKEQIKKRKNKKIIPIIILIIIAVLKIMVAALALVSFSLSLAYIVPALFALTAYVHIQHTGYYLAESGWFGGFRAMYRKAHSRFIARTPDNTYNYYDSIEEESEHGLNNMPDSIRAELDSIRKKFSADEANRRRYNYNRLPDTSALNVLVFGMKNQQSLRLIYNESRQEYLLTSWGPIKDIELTKLINGNAMSDTMKSFVGYSGLKSQNYKVPDFVY